MATRWVHDRLSLEKASLVEIGGKALTLSKLVALGLPVPPFYVVTTAGLAHVLGDVPIESFRGDDELLEHLRRRIAETAIPLDLRHSIMAVHQDRFPDGGSFAVRSSSVDEDGITHSFAGLHESILGVTNLEKIFEAIKRVWLSTFSDRVIAYRHRHGLPLLDAKMAVIIQEMVDATRSGVCFTCDPVTKSTERIVMSSVWGIGEGLVSGEFSADTFIVDRSPMKIEQTLVDKTEKLVLSPGRQGLQRRRVEDADRGAASLNSEQVLQVAKTALELEAKFGGPQDVEFCFDDEGRFNVLQTRAVTGLGTSFSREGHSAAIAPHMVWDNSNIVESYSGVTTPMTFSFVRRAYSIVYHCFAEVMGISPHVVKQNEDALNNMLGFFQGRVYYNLKNWYRLVRMFPGYRYNSRFMESMMGVKESLDLEDQPPPPGTLRRWFVELPALLGLLLRSGWNFSRIRKIVGRFERDFYGYYKQWSQIDFDELAPHEVKRLYDMMEGKMLWNWKAPIINDFFVMIFYGTLRKLCVTWCEGEGESLQNGLVCGEGGLLSDEPAKQILRMTCTADNDAALRDLILEKPLESLPGLIAGDPRFEVFSRQMSQYLRDYGLRCANELKLESYSYVDQPHRVYEMIRSYLMAEDRSMLDVRAIEVRQSELRRAAEQRVEHALSRYRGWMPRRLLFHWVLRNARLGIRNRENMRLARTRIYGILRRMLRSLGRKLELDGVLDEREDIFYLTIDELWDYLKGTAVTTDLRGLTRFRREEYDRYRRDAKPTERFETFGLPYQSLPRATPSRSHNSGDPLRGISCCPGIVTGTAQVIDDPSRESGFNGTILVAERTDPGWIPLFPAFSGILVERGSVLSHSAIVAREMGIPTIVGIPNLIDRITSGQRLRMDGGAGTVELLAAVATESGGLDSPKPQTSGSSNSSTQNRQ